MQAAQGVSALTSGVYFIPAFLATVVGVIGSGFLSAYVGRLREFIIAGMALLVVGTVLTGLLLQQYWSYGQVVGLTIEVGLGLGLCIATILLAIQNASPDADIGPATSVAFFGRNLGGIFAVTVVSAVVTNSLSSLLAPTLDPLVQQGLPSDLVPLIIKLSLGGELGQLLTKLPPTVATTIVEAGKLAVNDAIKRGFLSMVPLSVIGFLASLVIKHEPMRKDEAAVHVG